MALFVTIPIHAAFATPWAIFFDLDPGSSFLYTIRDHPGFCILTGFRYIATEIVIYIAAQMITMYILGSRSIHSLSPKLCS
jgi:hypothetical protein